MLFVTLHSTLDMAYLAEKALSKAGIHALLIYRSTTDDSKCYKFQWKRTNKNDFAYICHACEEAVDVGEKIGVVRSVRVKADYSEFLSDPEATGHFCEPLPYMAATVEQSYR